MPVKSLLELAVATCIKNIRELESVGDYLPYQTVKDILLKVDNAPQLRQIEINSPQIEGETGEIWLKIIERDFPMELKANYYKPSNPKKWYKVWEKYKHDHDAALEESERKLKNALAGLREDKEKNTSKIVHNKKYLPRESGKKRGWGRDPNTSTLNFNSGSRTKLSNGASVMRKVRREVKEIATIHGVLARSIKGPAQRTQLRSAPPAMVNDHRRAAQPVYRPLPKISEPSVAVAKHEERATFISDSEDDDDDNNNDDEPNEQFDEDEELSDQRPKKTARVAKDQDPRIRKAAPAYSGHARPPAHTGTSSSPHKILGGGLRKGSGLLSNSYKPSVPKPKVEGSVLKSTPASSSNINNKPKPAPIEEPPRRPAHQLPKVQSSPPASSAGSSLPTPQPSSLSVSEAPNRKRKPANVFVKRKRPA
ncbi:hypothetical protein S40288_05064 [Stachybotrys chartarum IBT 40288]|nr:hypothetical protein S40288_05064 [Stachybotrys chartarum IBT 40288]